MPHNTPVPELQPLIVIAALLALAPYLIAALFPQRFAAAVRRLPAWAQICVPALLSAPYMLVALSAGNFRWSWFGLYALVPVGIAVVVRHAPSLDRTILPHLGVLALLGLAVDLRWFEAAWPPHLAIFNKVLLLDAGIYAFAALRPLEGAGFDLRLRVRDLRTGLREFAFYVPIGLILGLWLGFLHTHPGNRAVIPLAGQFAAAWIFTFFFIAVPEELFFRGWLQNLLETRLGRTAALLITACLFGLSHFNKRALYFNWRYVLLATIAGIFYGRAWRRDRRVGASAVTHATVDAVWSLFLR